ncbi:MAG: peptidase M23 [Myxococcales bacterium]|nr:peptidase M23 [Myxococcales bacterium]
MGRDEKAAQEFESWMVSFMAKQMRESVEGGPWSEGAMATFADLFDQEIGKRVSEGGGFGLKESVLESWRGSAAPAAASRQHAHDAPPPPESLRVTSAFGVRPDPFSGRARVHHGLDLAAPQGTPVLAAAGGTVRYSGRRGGYGNVVIVEHDDGTETRYAHCRDLSVKVGERVASGQAIATVGSTGRSTGAHLHFEVRRGGEAIDPASWGGVSPLAEEKR